MRHLIYKHSYPLLMAAILLAVIVNGQSGKTRYRTENWITKDGNNDSLPAQDTPLTYFHPINTYYYYFNDDAVLTPSTVPIYITGDTCYYPTGSLKDKVVLGSFGGRYWMKGEEHVLKYSGDTLLQGTKKRHVLIAYSETGIAPFYRYMEAYQITHCFNLEYKKPCPWGGEDRCFIFFIDKHYQPFKKSIFIHNVIYL